MLQGFGILTLFKDFQRVAVCPEQPCILKCKNNGVMLLHVDDVLICGSEEWIPHVLIPKLESEFTSCLILW